MPMFRFVGTGVNQGEWKEIINPTRYKSVSDGYVEEDNGWYFHNGQWRHIYQRIPDLALSNLSAIEVGADRAVVRATLLHSEHHPATTVYLRYRRVGTDTWLSDSVVTDGANADFGIPALTPQVEYEAEASLDSNFGTAISVRFTTTTPVLFLQSIAISAITHGGATATVNIVNSSLLGPATVYIRYRKDGDTSWINRSLENQDGATAILVLSGLEHSSDYDVEASLESNFGTSVSNEFTTANPPAIGTVGNLRVVRSSRRTTTGGTFSEWSVWSAHSTARGSGSSRTLALADARSNVPSDTDTAEYREGSTTDNGGGPVAPVYSDWVFTGTRQTFSAFGSSASSARTAVLARVPATTATRYYERGSVQVDGPLTDRPASQRYRASIITGIYQRRLITPGTSTGGDNWEVSISVERRTRTPASNTGGDNWEVSISVERRTRTRIAGVTRTRYTFTAHWDAPTTGPITGYQVEVGGNSFDQIGTSRVISSNQSSSSNSTQVRVRVVNTGTNPDSYGSWAGPVSYS